MPLNNNEEQKRIPAVLMRGGTSRGLYVMRGALPATPQLRDQVILRMYGSPDVRQIDGIGGSDALTSKLAIIGPPTRPDADIDYTFAQVSVTKALVDYTGNCGNMSAGVGPFAIDQGLVDAIEPRTTVRIHQTNTRSLIIATVPVVNGHAAVEGNYHIDGVPGTGARIDLDFSDAAGGVTGHLLPTGNPLDSLAVPGVGDVLVSIVDAGNPCVFVRATDLGIRGTETPAQIDADQALNDRIERVRGAAAVKIGLVREWSAAAQISPYVPFLVLLSPPADYVDFTTGQMIRAEQVDVVARLLFMLKMHKTYAVTGTVCTGAAAKIKGTLVEAMVRPTSRDCALVRIGHPAGIIEIEAAVETSGKAIRLIQASIGRTARRIMEGYILIPWRTLEPE